MDNIGPSQSWLPKSLRKFQAEKRSLGALPSERSRLLAKRDDEDQEDEEVHELEESQDPTAKKVLTEFKILLRGSLPVVLAYTLQNSLQTVSVLIVGRRSPEDLATAAFAYMFAWATAWLIGLGGSTALDTLGSTAFTGSKNRHDLGVLLQRAFIILGLSYIPIVILWLFSEPLFLALGESQQLSRDSRQFLCYLIPGGLGYIYFEAMKKFLQAQGEFCRCSFQYFPNIIVEIMRAGTYVLLVTAPINAGINYLFIYTFKMGLVGAPLATSITYWLSFLLLVAYARYIHGWEAWGGWSRQCLHNLGTFARIAFLGFIHVGTEWWAFEIVALVAGRLGTIPLASQSVIMSSDQVMNTIPFGVGVATSARVGNLLGAKNPQGAARAANTAAWLSMILGAVVLAILLGTKDHFAKIFNSDPSVVKLTAEVLPFVALFQIADGLNGSCGGSLRGMGKQHIGAAINIVSYYCIALPLGIYMAFHGWGLKGLWVGQCIALYIVGILEWGFVAFSNWDLQVEKAFGRMDHDERTEEGRA
ncbi:MAG: hypothetical protein Q9167_001898 [Letrouitia subvulpina]